MTGLGYFLNVASYLRVKIAARWQRVPIGTRSVLIGAHAFYLHPFFVAAAWTKLYGFPFDPRLWVAFFVHDLGYWGKPNIDGAEGERHVEFGARVMGRLGAYWHDFSLYHSRHYAKQAGARPSKLCFADKLAFRYQIKPLYLLMTGLTGELHEYLENAKYGRGMVTNESPSAWYDSLKVYMVNWVEDHKDGAEDTVTVLKDHANKTHALTL